jgi:hypothetical protein
MTRRGIAGFKQPTYTQQRIENVSGASIVDFLLWSEALNAPDYVRSLVGRSRTYKGVHVQQTTTAVADAGTQTGVSTSGITPPHA